ncbi:putative ribonuclease H-like domain-containing protein [Tanacetum coccineum]|uniref:Ribonuclease H-like domain-containing protein n=1 Tax=Tanacetum coccineum TaxID=301880 RepID=A0ABQ5E0I7_9ASTR
MAKASPAQARLWHRRRSHLNFDTINMLSKNDIVNGLLKLRYVKDQLCSSCDLGKAKRSSFKTKIVPSSKGRLHLLHMDLCGLMRIERINGKKYVLVVPLRDILCGTYPYWPTILNRLERKFYFELGSKVVSELVEKRSEYDDLKPSYDEIPPPPLQIQTPTQQAPHTISTIKLPILKKGEYDIWAMKMEHYLAHTDYPIWEVIQRGNGPKKCGKLSNLDLVAMMNRRRCKRVSTEDAKLKFLRSLPSVLSQISLIMRTKPGVDSLSFDDLYNKLSVFKPNVKGSTASSSSMQNVAFVSKNTNSTNEVSTTYGASSSSGQNPQREGSSSYTDELMYSFFSNQSSGPQLDHEDLEQLDEFDLEEIDLKWQVAMISMRLKKFYKKTGRKLQFDAKEPVGFDKAKVECYNYHKIGHFARECRSKGNQDSRRRDAGYTGHSEDEQENYALMAFSNSGSDTEAYTQALKKVEAQLVAHQQNQLWYEEKIRFVKIDLDDKTDVLTYHKKLLAKAEKEKEELKAGLGYSNQMNKGVLSYENEVFKSVFYSKSSDIEDSPVNDRYAEGMHAVPPPMTGIYILSGPDVEIDESQFTYGLKQSKPSESDASSSDFNSCESNSSEEPLKSMPELVVNEPKVVSQPKVWSDAPIIEEYESDSDDEHVSLPTKEQETSSFTFVNTVKHVKTPRQTVKEQNTCSQNPKPDKKDCSGLMSKKLGLGYGFTKKACFVCGSFSHLIRDCDFHEKRMAKQAELNKRMCKGTGQRENRPIWNNVQRVNHQNQFVPIATLTRTGRIPVNIARASNTNNVNTARHNFNSQATPTNATRKVNTVKPIVNNDVPHKALENKGIVDSGCSRHMTRNKAYLAEYQDYNGGPVPFGGSKGYITGKGPKEANHSAVTKDNIDAENSKMEAESAQDYFVLPIWSSYTSTVKSSEAKNEAARASSTNTVNTASTPVSTASPSGGLSYTDLTNSNQDDSQIPALEDSYDNPNDGIFTNASSDDEGTVADFTNLETIANVSHIPTSRIHYIHPLTQILGDSKSAVQTRSKVKKVLEPMLLIEATIRIFLAFASYMGFIVYQMDVKSAFLYGTIDEEVYVSQPPGFVDPKCPKKVYKVVKALYGLHQAPRAWYATLSTFLLKSGYRRGTIDKTLFIKKDKNDIMLVQVYVDDIIFGSTKRSWCDEFEALMKSRFQMSSMGELTFFLGLQVKQKEDGIFISQDKYVAEILKKFDFASVKTASTPIETQKPLVKDEEATDVDVHLYRSMISSLMYLTASRPDIMFAVCACSRFQVTPKTSHLNAMKRIFRYLKGKPKLGLWYPRVSSFDLEAYSDSDYAGANLDRKSTTGEAEYVAAVNCCGQVLWIQNQILDYGFNFMNTNIYNDNESTICIVKNPVFHSKTKHIEIRHHFIRDAYEKKLIQVLKIHTDDNVADLLTKAFDVSRFNF